MSYSPNSTNADRDKRAELARRIITWRASYLHNHSNHYALENWEDASVEYANLTGREHPMGRIPLSASSDD